MDNPVPDTRDNCFYCGVDLDHNVPSDSPLRPETDHFISKANGGSNARENKVTSCIPCNRRKGKLNGDQFLKIIREEREVHEPRNYTMPESFMYDQKVPARWRLLGVINGFHIAGLPFYASNEWLKAKLRCSEQTITNAVAELEESGEIRCERTSTSRRIYRTSDPSQLGSRPKLVRVSDPSQLGTNSVSNSEKNRGVAIAPPPSGVKFNPGGEEPLQLSKSAAKYSNARNAFKWFPEIDPAWGINSTELKAGVILFEKGEEKVRKNIKYCQPLLGVDGFPIQRLTPYLLTTNWERIYEYSKRG